MKSCYSWCEKYELGLKENLTIKDIMVLRDCGKPKATQIRNDVIDYCIKNDIDFESRKVPTEIVFIVTQHDLEYYYNKMILESRSLSYCGA